MAVAEEAERERAAAAAAAAAAAQAAAGAGGGGGNSGGGAKAALKTLMDRIPTSQVDMQHYALFACLLVCIHALLACLFVGTPAPVMAWATHTYFRTGSQLGDVGSVFNSLLLWNG
jgi:hypothetical protein